MLLEDLAGWCAGAGAGASITVLQWSRDPAAFWFDNVTAQRLRAVPPKGWARFEYLFYTVHDSVIQYPWLAFIIVAEPLPLWPSRSVRRAMPADIART